MGTEAQLEPQPGGLYLVNVTGARFARGSFREVVPVHRLAYSFGWDGSEVVPPGSSLVEIDLMEICRRRRTPRKRPEDDISRRERISETTTRLVRTRSRSRAPPRWKGNGLAAPVSLDLISLLRNGAQRAHSVRIAKRLISAIAVRATPSIRCRDFARRRQGAPNTPPCLHRTCDGQGGNRATGSGSSGRCGA